MADVPYTPGSGVTISADLVGTTLFQRNKIVLGTSGTNLGDVDVTNPFPVTGTVTASVSTVVEVSGVTAVSVVSTIVTILGTQIVSVVPGLSVSAVVSGTVAISVPVSQTIGTIIAVSGVTAVSAVSTIVTLLGTVAVNVVA